MSVALFFQVTPEAVEAILGPLSDADGTTELLVQPDDYAEIFHETYSQYESMQRDSQTFIGGVVPASRDWGRAHNLKLPPTPVKGRTGEYGW